MIASRSFVDNGSAALLSSIFFGRRVFTAIEHRAVESALGPFVAC